MKPLTQAFVTWAIILLALYLAVVVGYHLWQVWKDHKERKKRLEHEGL